MNFASLNGDAVLNKLSSPNLQDLDKFAATIRAADQGVTNATTNLIENALAAGDALLKAKEKIGHGNWLPWLRDACDLSEDRAERYMRIARGRAVLEANSACLRNLSLTGAVNLIKEQERNGSPPPTKRPDTRTDSKGRKQPATRRQTERAKEQQAERKPTATDATSSLEVGADFKARDDIGAKSSGETERQLARLDELENTTRRLERENIALRSEIEEAKRTLNPLAWSEASSQARQRFLGGIGPSGLLAAVPPTWGLAARMLRAVSKKKLLGELERRMPADLWKKHQTALKAMSRALDAPGEHAGSTLELKAIAITDGAMVKH